MARDLSRADNDTLPAKEGLVEERFSPLSQNLKTKNTFFENSRRNFKFVFSSKLFKRPLLQNYQQLKLLTIHSTVQKLRKSCEISSRKNKFQDGGFSAITKGI